MPRDRSLLLIALLSLPALSLAAQEGSRAPAAETTLAGRMEAFLREVPEAPNTALAAFFPRRGDWTWTQRLRQERGGQERTGVWRFPGAETLRAIGAGGPVCGSFD